MGLELGHVTADEIWPADWSVSKKRNAQLKVLGNGVVWQQAAAGVRYLLERVAA